MSNRRTPPPDLGTPPQQYDVGYMLTLTRKIESFGKETKTPGQWVEGSLSLINSPTNGGGLRPGDIFVDGNGFLKLVRTSDIYAPSLKALIKVGKAVAA